MQEDNARDDSKIEITLLKVITYGLQTYSEEVEAGIVHVYKLILGLVRDRRIVKIAYSSSELSTHECLNLFERRILIQILNAYYKGKPYI